MYEQMLDIEKRGGTVNLNDDAFVNVRTSSNTEIHKYSSPVFDEHGKLLLPGNNGGQYDTMRKMEMHYNRPEFNAGGIQYKRMQDQEVIRMNIEKLGGFEPTLESKDELIL